jgi:histidine ammonia-lyase
MGMTSANNLQRVLDNVEAAIACELLGAVVAIDLRHPLRMGRGTRAAYEIVRERIAPWTNDRPPAPDIAAARELIRSHRLVEAAEAATGHRFTG